jgi:hypothetical protein
VNPGPLMTGTLPLTIAAEVGSSDDQADDFGQQVNPDAMINPITLESSCRPASVRHPSDAKPMVTLVTCATGAGQDANSHHRLGQGIVN